MKKQHFMKVCMVAGFFVYFMAWVQKFIMTLDIPISFSTGEARVVYATLFISAGLLICAAFVMERKQSRYVLIAIVGALLVLNCSTYKTGMNAEYFTPAYAQLILSFILHNLLVIAGTTTFLIQSRRALKSDEFDYA